jgi:hypothetical protein
MEAGDNPLDADPQQFRISPTTNGELVAPIRRTIIKKPTKS